PDQFGHSRAIPQIISDLTKFKAMVLWRGVGEEINFVPFLWKSNIHSKKEILCNYLPFGYGNASHLPDKLENLSELIEEKVKDLQPYSPFSLYLLMNGTDHHQPQEELIDLVAKITNGNKDIKIQLLESYIDKLSQYINQENYLPTIFTGEFRSSLRAPLLQDTYSARMWIKIWDNKIEDLLVHYAEPLSTFTNFYLEDNYPTSYLLTAWKWLLKNQPHDSICGCSVDEVHEEMKGRYLSAESIATTIINDKIEKINNSAKKNSNSSILTFNPTNNSIEPSIIKFNVDYKENVKAIKVNDGIFDVQKGSTVEEVIFEDTLNPFMVKTGLKLLPGRKLMDVYINEVYVSQSYDPTICDVTMICANEPIGDFDEKEMAQGVLKLIDEKKYQKYHVKATKGNKQTYYSITPLPAWSFSKIDFIYNTNEIDSEEKPIFNFTKNTVTNQFYDLTFNKNGTFNLTDKTSNSKYLDLHQFEDWGDRGDEYTFGRLGPMTSKIRNVKRKITMQGPIICEITQTYEIVTFKELNTKRDKRIGKTAIPAKTIFTFYRDINRIDIKTELENNAKDHRLRICFNLPFKKDETITSTHFGHNIRKGSPDDCLECVEKPSGIQAQKRFIRVDETSGNSAITLFNKGLPEIELVGKSYLALTLVRSIGYLSRMDFPERPIHAGPFMETPGAQEMHQKYVFQYGISAHSRSMPITYSYDLSEAINLPTQSILMEKSSPNELLLKPIISITNPLIRISSLRTKEGKVIVTLYNIHNEKITSTITVNEKIQTCNSIFLDGSIKNPKAIIKGNIELAFEPFEIKILRLE
ncbi:MAG: glycoside hydrolase family 38 C-terminal domain-containing protein, partial [Candidatus Thorarchaeota archaeon]